MVRKVRSPYRRAMSIHHSDMDKELIFWIDETLWLTSIKAMELIEWTKKKDANMRIITFSDERITCWIPKKFLKKYMKDETTKY